MTNNTINNVPRELLENIVLCYNEGEFELGTLAAECHTLLSASSPAGVDGLDVVGYFFQHEETGNVMSVDAQQVDWGFEANNPRLHRVCALADYDKAQAIIDGLRGEADQQAQRIGELEGLLRDSAELIKHGVFEDGYCCCGSSVDSHVLGDGHSPVDALAYHAGQVCERIDAALSAGKDSVS